jgi:altronate hydrolase
MERVLKLHRNDNILVALQDLRKGERVSLDGQDYVLISDIPAKHKFAAEDLAAGARVVMYGVVVGKTRDLVLRGEIIATRNVSHSTEAFHENSAEYRWTAPDVGRWRG